MKQSIEKEKKEVRIARKKENLEESSKAVDREGK